MTILVTGGTGQLALALQQEAHTPITRTGRPTFDLETPATIDATFHAAAPTLVVNAAAWTAVDDAENHPEAAMRANCSGPAHLARLCARNNIPLIHISTDYVFDGDKHAPYTESDTPNPTGTYGRTKLAGEHAVLEAHPRAIILRTSWVYSATGRNFLKTMLGAALKRETLSVVADQKGCPTSARDLAAAILALATRLQHGSDDSPPGIYHAAGTGWTTWHGLATTIFEAAAPLGHKTATVTPIATADWPTPTRRPPDSRLDCSKLAKTFGIRLPDWRNSVATTVAEYISAIPAEA